MSPASAPVVLGLQVCATVPGFKITVVSIWGDEELEEVEVTLTKTTSW